MSHRDWYGAYGLACNQRVCGTVRGGSENPALTLLPEPPSPDMCFVLLTAPGSGHNVGPAEVVPTTSKGQGMKLQVTAVDGSGAIKVLGVTVTSCGSGYADKEVLNVTQGGVWKKATMTVQRCPSGSPYGLGYTLCGTGSAPCIMKASGVAQGGGGGTCGEWKDPEDFRANSGIPANVVKEMQKQWGEDCICPSWVGC